MGKEKTIVELQQEKTQLQAREQEILADMRKEARMMTDAETKEMGEIQARKVEINSEIAERNHQSATAKGVPVHSAERFSLRRAILNAARGAGQTDAELQVMERAAELHRKSGCDDLAGQICIPLESRAMFTAATEAATGVVIDEEKMEMLLPLEANLVLSKAGVRMMTGLQGNIYWPKFSGVEVYWEEENATAKDAGGAFSKGTVFTPKRLTATAKFSKQLLIQQSENVEALIRQSIAQAMAQKIEQTAFSKEKLSDAAPTGIFYDKALDCEGAMSWANIVGLETKMAAQNALFGNLAYIMRPELLGVAKTKVKDASGAGGFVFDGSGNGSGILNGYKALASTNMVSKLGDSQDEHGIVFGNWADYFLGQWGSLDLVIDPYSGKNESILEVTITMWANMGMIRPESFAIGSLK